MIQEHKNWIKNKIPVYQRCIEYLNFRVTRRLDNSPKDPLPPASDECMKQARKIIDFMFQMHPEIYNGNLEKTQLKQISIFHQESEILVEYLRFFHTTHEFTCYSDGEVSYVQILHGEQHMNEQYEEDKEVFTDKRIIQHIRRQCSWPKQPKAA